MKKDKCSQNPLTACRTAATKPQPTAESSSDSEVDAPAPKATPKPSATDRPRRRSGNADLRGELGVIVTPLLSFGLWDGLVDNAVEIWSEMQWCGRVGGGEVSA